MTYVPLAFLPLSFLWATTEHQLTGSRGCTSTQSTRGRDGRERGNWSGVDIACSDGKGHLSRVEDRSIIVQVTFSLIQCFFGSWALQHLYMYYLGSVFAYIFFFGDGHLLL